MKTKIAIIMVSLTLISFNNLQAATSVETSRDFYPQKMNVDGALLIGGPSTAAGVEVGVATRLLSRAPVFIGGSVSGFVTTGSFSYAIIPLLADLHYEFTPLNSVHPLLGLLAGPVISTGPGDSHVDFSLMFRPGISFNLDSATLLNVEARFGVMGGDFVSAPQMGITFLL